MLIDLFFIALILGGVGELIDRISHNKLDSINVQAVGVSQTSRKILATVALRI